MTKSTTVITQSRKKPGPKPTGKGTLLGVRVHEPMLTQIDKWAKQNGGLSRPEAIRQMITDYLSDHDS